MLAHHLFAPWHDAANSVIPSVLRTLRGLVFPGNAPLQPTDTPPTPDSQDDRRRAARRAAAFAILNSIPRPLARLYLPTAAAADAADEVDAMVSYLDANVLSLFQDAHMNKGLLYPVLDMLVAALLPELARDGAAKGVAQLLVERGVLAAPVAA